jgi:hypothetical protein
MSRVSRFNISNRKKGILALEALIGTILSVIALVVLFQMFSNLILTTPSNLDIAENNIQNFENFINMPEQIDMDSYNNCFFSLKMNHLENFQYEEQGKNYFYVFKDDGVYIGDLLSQPVFLDEWEDNGNSDLIKKKLDWDINLKNDISKSSLFDLEILFVDISYFSRSSEDIELNDYDNYIVTFTPRYYDFFGDPNNQNEYEVQIFEDGKFKNINGQNLYFANSYKNDKNVLFFDKTEYTNLLAKESLCSRVYLNNILTSDSLSVTGDLNKNSIDYINKKITFEFPIDDTIVNIIYEGGDIVCSIDCTVYFNNLQQVTYNSFLEGLNKIFKKVNTKNSKIVSLDDYIRSIEETDIKTNLVEFKDISQKLDKNDVSTNFNFEGIFTNSNINGCRTDECNQIFYKDTKLYFMINEISNKDYFTIHDHFFRKVNSNEIIPTKILLGNNEYDVGEIEIDGEGNGFNDDDKDIYVIRQVEVIHNNQIIFFNYYLTKNQLKKIPHTTEVRSFNK